MWGDGRDFYFFLFFFGDVEMEEKLSTLVPICFQGSQSLIVERRRQVWVGEYSR